MLNNFLLNKWSSIRKKSNELGFIGLVELMIHPILVPLFSIRSWYKSLLNSRILLRGQWGRYHGFHAQNAINSLFYRTQWINLKRYGRTAKSPVIGLGDFPLNKWWHLSSAASFIYAYAAAVTTLSGTLFLVFTHLVWLQNVEWQWVLMVTTILFFSSTTLLMAFHSQNYQILSWMWLPIALYGLLSQHLLVSALGFLAAGFFGITAIFVSTPLVIVQAVITGNYLTALILLPAYLVIFLNFIPLIKSTGVKESIVTVGKIIGLIHTDVHYQRRSLKFGIHHLYFFCLYGAMIALFWIGTNEFPVLLAISYFLYVVNQLFLRFSDDQSVMLLFFSVAASSVLAHGPNWFTLAGLVIAVNPMPAYIGSGYRSRVRNYTPFDVEPLLQKMKDFLAVPEKSKILFAFDNPQKEYEKIFDGYRILLEVPLLAASEKEIHLFPDWYAVLLTNYTGSPNIWGRNLDETKQNLAFWKAGYVIIYQDTNTEINPEWLASFEVVSVFDWGIEFPQLHETGLINPNLKAPKWWLIKKRHL
jgi:hypothetical protein